MGSKNMLHVLTTTILFLMSMSAPEASRVLPESLQMQASQNDFTSDHYNDVVSPALLYQQLHRAPVPPSGPNPSGPNTPRAQFPTSTNAPLPGSLLKSPPPHAMLNGDTSNP
jgi:hypothetical protein